MAIKSLKCLALICIHVIWFSQTATGVSISSNDNDSNNNNNRRLNENVAGASYNNTCELAENDTIMRCYQDTTIIFDASQTTSGAEEEATAEIVVDCPRDDMSDFDYRKNENFADCTCTATVTTTIDSNNNPRQCTCQVCPLNFGDAPLSLDCSDASTPSLLGGGGDTTCQSLDCAYTCDGSCIQGCDVAGSACPLCPAGNTGGGNNAEPTMAPATAGQPTPSPTSANERGNNPSSLDSSAKPRHQRSSSFAVLLGIGIVTILWTW